MNELWTFLGVMVIAALIASWVLSSKAKKDREFAVRIPDGQNVQQVVSSVIAGLPSGWSPVGSKRGHDFLQSNWSASEDGGNLLNVSKGSILTGHYVVSVEMGVLITDEFGREVGLPFDQVPPQADYLAHIWVSYAARGQGRLWFPTKSLAILRVKDYLEGALSSAS